MQVLSCCSTPVEDLSPLSACVGLQVLRMRNTPVLHLAPLAACTALRKLSCSLGGGGEALAGGGGSFRVLKGAEIARYIAAHP